MLCFLGAGRVNDVVPIENQVDHHFRKAKVNE